MEKKIIGIKLEEEYVNRVEKLRKSISTLSYYDVLVFGIKVLEEKLRGDKNDY